MISSERDEREVSVDRAADRLSYLVLSFGLLAVVAYRSFVASEAAWDLLGLIVLAGLAGTVYRARAGAITRGWALVVLATVTIAAGVALVLAFATRS
jgi:hypothetical protein